MPRKINPRRIVLAHLRIMKRDIVNLINGWDIRMTVAEPYAQDDGSRNHRWRTRREDEKPENVAEAWAVTFGEAIRIREAADQLRERAWDEYRALTGRCLSE